MVPCICINAKNKPDTIPDKQWINEGSMYHITFIYYHTVQGIQGVELKEVNLNGCDPYESYRLDRFAFTIDGLKQLFALMKSCTELNDLDIEELIKEQELITHDS